MCGRISQSLPFGELQSFFDLAGGTAPETRYNLAPSESVAAVRVEEGQRRLVLLHWGLIPFWSKDARGTYRTINARAERVDRAPAYRAAFRSRRCLIPVSGFYEWDQKGGTRQPYHIRRRDEKPLALAGLWERWEGGEGDDPIESCTILTTAAVEPVASLHERMPVILEPETFGAWLDPEQRRVEDLKELLLPPQPDLLRLVPVSRYVNKAGNEGERCIEPVFGEG